MLLMFISKYETNKNLSNFVSKYLSIKVKSTNPGDVNEYINRLSPFVIFNGLVSLRKKCPYSDLFWSVFSRIQSESGKIRTEKTPNTDTCHAVYINIETYLGRCQTSLM